MDTLEETPIADISATYLTDEQFSRSFKQSHAAREITYRAKLKNPSDDVPLNNLLTHLHALFETILQETKREYGDAGVMRIYISHPKLEKSIIIPPT